MQTAYKIIEQEAWAAAKLAGVFQGSAVDRADGYIHLSAADQLEETARRHFAGGSDLVLLTVDLTRLGEAVRWEPSRGGALFPHLYGPLPAAAVLVARAFEIDGDGVMRFADGGAACP